MTLRSHLLVMWEETNAGKYRAAGIIKWITVDKENRVIFEDWVPGQNTCLTVIKPEKFSYDTSEAMSILKKEAAEQLQDEIQDQGDWIIVGGVKLEKVAKGWCGSDPGTVAGTTTI